MGLSAGAGERLNRSYAYNYFGDVVAQAFASARQMRSQKPSTLTEDTTIHRFTYDGLGRLTEATDGNDDPGSYSRSYSYDGASRLTAFNRQSYGHGDAGPYHAVDRIDGSDRFDYDANGNTLPRAPRFSDHGKGAILEDTPFAGERNQV